MEQLQSFLTPSEDNITYMDDQLIHDNNTNDERILNEDETWNGDNNRINNGDDYILPSLNFYIKILFALNGAIEVVPDLVLTSLINDRAQMPLEYIPSYYAIQFLPYSLKPVYAILTYELTSTQTTATESNDGSEIHGTERSGSNHGGKSDHRIQRHSFIVILQVLASMSLIGTAFLPPKILVPYFILGLLRGCTISWSEFLNGLVLISSAKSISKKYYMAQIHNHHSLGRQLQQHNDHFPSTRHHEEKLLSLHQSQAAMSRNIGCLFGQILIFGVIVGRNQLNGTKDKALSDQFVTLTLICSAVIPLAAAIVAYIGRVGSSTVNLFTNTAAGTTATNEEIGVEESTSARRGSPIINIDNKSSRNLHIKRVGIYLMLRHATPTTLELTESFVYTVFRSMPQYLQLKSVLASIVAVLSSWFYGRYISKIYSNVEDVSKIIVITTGMSALCSLLFIPFLEFFRDVPYNKDIDDESSAGFQGNTTILVLFTLFQLVQNFLSGLSFLPSVILGTNTTTHHIANNEDYIPLNQRNENDDEFAEGGGGHRQNNTHDESYLLFIEDEVISNDEEDILSLQRPLLHHVSHGGNSFVKRAKSSIQRWLLDYGILYGLMMTSIDFGDQLGSWIAGPIVKELGISRENNWENLNLYIIICVLLAISSLGFLPILWHSSKPIDR